ncbi:MAG: cyclase family protein [Eubacterium sp.]|nr:cyclase family protein [Eubacterium sp.]
MAKLNLWEVVNELKSSSYKWVDLTHELSAETPHWYGFDPLKSRLIFDNAEDAAPEMKAPMRCIEYTVVSQYGTHVDVPKHFHVDGRPMNEIQVQEMVYPLVVVDKHEECAANPEFTLKVEDLQKWEEEYGRIPEGAFVAFRSDWYKLDDLDNKDADGNPHCPGWDTDAIRWLVEERNIGAIGHEPADTDPSYVTTSTDSYPYPAEDYILEVDRIQIEVMRNLDQVPPVGSMIVCAFPKLKDGVGFSARCFAICPAE